ncbi:hypothetical protein AWB74_08312 [Caballeronia arvi]|uniref:Uncharacterized protein n=1 Tax=Caballeronia arvi TaxID=1777135 RepID=A0A158L3C6_9BURK|nr:hypothetical protein AWB74_08312 [Caballeronia arvi]
MDYARHLNLTSGLGSATVERSDSLPPSTEFPSRRLQAVFAAAHPESA